MSYYFHTDPHDPTLDSKGTDPNNAGKYRIAVFCPNSLEEPDRVSCELTMKPSTSSPEITIADGGIFEPFDGTKITTGNLSAGTYIFRAKADYENSDQVQGPNGLTVTIP